MFEQLGGGLGGGRGRGGDNKVWKLHVSAEDGRVAEWELVAGEPAGRVVELEQFTKAAVAGRERGGDDGESGEAEAGGKGRGVGLN